MDMQKILDRIDKLANEQGVSLSALSVQSGMSKDGIRNWKRRLEKEASFGVSHNNLKGVADALGVSIEDLTRAPHASNQAPEPQPVTMVPVYDVHASAGAGSVVCAEDELARLSFPIDYLRHLTRANPRDLAIISVRGDSMLPTLANEDLVMLDTSDCDISHDGLFVIRDVGEALLVKRIGRASAPGCVTIISDNRALYDPVEKSLADIAIIGKVIWSGGKV